MKPLAGIRVLDLSRLLPGPYATHVLGELGASVDKLEDTDAGDYMRSIPPNVTEEGREMGAMFTLLNRGKRSLTLDLKTEAGRTTFLALLPHYDVLLDQFRPSVLGRLKLGHASLIAAHPPLIICALTGYGQTGPLASRAGHDLNYLARGGVLGFQGPAGGVPTVPSAQIADIGGALYAVIAILGALRERDRTGAGAILDVSMQDAAMTFAVSGFASALAGIATPRGEEALAGGLSVYSTYVTSDAQYMAFAALEPKFWTAFCIAVGWEVDMTALIPGPHQHAWKTKLTALFRMRTRDAWTQLGAKHQVCLEPVLTPQEAIDDPHVRQRTLFVHGADNVCTLGLPFRAASSVPNAHQIPPATSRAAAEGDARVQNARAPLRGEHTHDILAEFGLPNDTRAPTS